VAPRPRTGGPDTILEAALEVIARDGVGAVTVRSIAARADVSPGTITHHFPSIDELLVAALNHGSSRVINSLERLALSLQDSDWNPDGWAMTFAQTLAQSIDEHPADHIACFELRLLAIRRPALRPATDEILAAYLRIARIILHAIDAPNPDIGAGRLVARTVGVVLNELGTPPEGRAERIHALLSPEACAPDNAPTGRPQLVVP
jgi:AcrR family transcriptional regulator